MTTCPNCGEDADELVAPDESITISDYESFCHIGSQRDDDLAGYGVVHK